MASNHHHNTTKARYACGLKDYDHHVELDPSDDLATAKETAQDYARDLAGALASTEEDTTIEWYVQETDKTEEAADEDGCACSRKTTRSTAMPRGWRTPRPSRPARRGTALVK